MLTTFIQETPCKSIPATCMGPTEYKCVPGMQKLSEFSAGSNVVREIKPGSPAVCGHGNREFSFLARRGKLTTHVMVVFLGGGICWDAETCAAEGAGRTISMDSLHSRNPDSSPAVPFEVKQDLGTPGKAFRLGIFDSASTELDNPFTRWSLLVIPDCTGDQHIGNRSYTYDAGKETCRTVDDMLLLKIAPRFRTTWLALWSLNGGTEPDVSEQGRIFRFGHELHLAAGDSLADLATRMGTTVEQIVDANDNRLTHIQNAQRLGEWANTRVHVCALVDEALGSGC